MAATDSGLRLGIDIGGTFTDVVAASGDSIVFTKKVPSTTGEYVETVETAIKALLSEGKLKKSILREVVHGTTIGANAILEKKGSKTGLITTKGFRDVLEIRRLRMPELYNISWDKPRPLVERNLRLEVDERINHRGEVLRKLDVNNVARVVEKLVETNVESIAVCLLNSYANPAHERIIGDMIAERYPDLHVSLSHEILPEIEEYGRTSTTVVNAYIMPVVKGYLERIESMLTEIGVDVPILVMQSNGGMMTSKAAMKRPVSTIESGPAAGVVASAYLATEMSLKDVITLDMGGTTAKASLIENGQLKLAHEYEVGGGITTASRLIRGGGQLVRSPGIDIAEVGAGGGSIALVDKGGALHVGPSSAGAVPGPVCYDIGGTQPTVTDADLVLGYINPNYLLGGALKLNGVKAFQVIEEKIAKPLGMDVPEAAYGIHLVAVSNMIKAVKSVSSQRGIDPRKFALFAFGGNGPLYATEIAGSLGIKKTVVPLYPGLFSAFGLLVAKVEYHSVQTFIRRTDELDLSELNESINRVEDNLMATLQGEGQVPQAIEISRFADLRYTGQFSELVLPLPPKQIGTDDVAALRREFETEHRRIFGHAAGDTPIQIVNLRLVAVEERPSFRFGRNFHSRGERRRPTQETRKAFFGTKLGHLDCKVLGRKDIGKVMEGPLIIEEYDATTLVPPGSKAILDEIGNIIIES